MKIEWKDANLELTFQSKSLFVHSRLGDRPELQDQIQAKLVEISRFVYKELVVEKNGNS